MRRYFKIHFFFFRFLIRLKEKFRTIMNLRKETYVWDRIVEYGDIWKMAATTLKADFSEIDHGLWKIRLGKRQTLIHNYMVGLDDPVKLSIAGNKTLCFKLFSDLNISLPQYLLFKPNEIDKIKNIMEKTDDWFVIKPAKNSAAGMGITTHVRNYKEAFKAAALASLYDDEILLEQLIAGESYRLLFLNSKFLHAARRTGLRVTGNGNSSIKNLIMEKFENHSISNKILSNNVLEKDPDLYFTLKHQTLSLDSVLPEGQTVLVKSVDYFSRNYSEVRTLYTENVSHLLCESIIQEAQKTAELLKFEFLGVDVITSDPTLPLNETGGVIDEINTTPGLHHHYNLEVDINPQPTAVEILKYLLSKDSF